MFYVEKEFSEYEFILEVDELSIYGNVTQSLFGFFFRVWNCAVQLYIVPTWIKELKSFITSLLPDTYMNVMYPWCMYTHLRRF